MAQRLAFPLLVRLRSGFRLECVLFLRRSDGVGAEGVADRHPAPAAPVHRHGRPVRGAAAGLDAPLPRRPGRRHGAQPRHTAGRPTFKTLLRP